MAIRFEISATKGRARRGVMTTPHGPVDTPAFMPVGTAGSVKALDPDDLRRTGSQIVLGNTYHLMLRPGHEVIQRLGGLHHFMGWSGPMLTDSGGFQVFSMAPLRRIDFEGITFRSHIDGSLHHLSPEKAIQIQEALGADVIMCLDECPPFPIDRGEMEAAVERTSRWAKQCREAHESDESALFGIVQGGLFEDLRAESTRALVALDMAGYAVGGLSVGEEKDDFRRILAYSLELLPVDKPRYLMGVGSPEDLVEGVRLGADLFDCVMPTRHARNGQIFTSEGVLNIRNAAHFDDPRPLDSRCGCCVCQTFSRAYLRHLFLARELLVYRLLSLHNLTYYQTLMAALREAIISGRLPAFREVFYETQGSIPPGVDKIGSEAAA